MVRISTAIPANLTEIYHRFPHSHQANKVTKTDHNGLVTNPYLLTIHNHCPISLQERAVKLIREPNQHYENRREMSKSYKGTHSLLLCPIKLYFQKAS